MSRETYNPFVFGMSIRRHQHRPSAPAWWFLTILQLVVCLTTACQQRPVARLATFADATLIEGFEELHRPIYRVYAMGTDRDRIHRHLASTFAGEELTREYVEHFTTLARMERERTAIEVLRIDYDSVRLLERRRETATIDAQWSVSGLVTHQGHRHPRINRYRAIYTLALDTDAAGENPDSAGGGLRIVDTRMRSAERTAGSPPVGALDEMPSSPAGTLSMEELLRSGLAQELLDAAEGKSAAPADGASSPSDPP